MPNTTKIPEAIMNAAVELLRPYVEGLSADTLDEALKSLTTGQNRPSAPDRLLTVQEVCERLTCSRTALWRLGKNGTLRPVAFLGRPTRYRESDVSKLLKKARLK